MFTIPIIPFKDHCGDDHNLAICYGQLATCDKDDPDQFGHSADGSVYYKYIPLPAFRLTSWKEPELLAKPHNNNMVPLKPKVPLDGETLPKFYEVTLSALVLAGYKLTMYNDMIATYRDDIIKFNSTRIQSSDILAHYTMHFNDGLYVTSPDVFQLTAAEWQGSNQQWMLLYDEERDAVKITEAPTGGAKTGDYAWKYDDGEDVAVITRYLSSTPDVPYNPSAPEWIDYINRSQEATMWFKVFRKGSGYVFKDTRYGFYLGHANGVVKLRPTLTPDCIVNLNYTEDYMKLAKVFSSYGSPINPYISSQLYCYRPLENI